MPTWISFVAIGCFSILISSASWGSETIRNVATTAHGAPEGATLEEIGRAIVQAAGERQWYGSVEGPGLIVVSTVIRTHRASVEIGFDERNFRIDYRDSLNLDYNPKDLVRWGDGGTRGRQVVTKGPRIHKSYNVWVQDLADHVALRLRPIITEARDRAVPAGPALVADELEKLDRLRQRGVLTQSEFDGQKAKLLSR